MKRWVMCLGFSIVAATAWASLPFQTVCPPPEQLVKQSGVWVGPGGWRSYEDSLDTRVIRFLGARWRGLNVGHVFCIYRGDEPYSFPIQLTNALMAKLPQGKHWQQGQGERANEWRCSGLRTDCVFAAQDAPKALDTPEDVRNLLRSIKS